MPLSDEHLIEDISNTLSLVERETAISLAENNETSFTELSLSEARLVDNTLVLIGSVVAVSPRYAELDDDVAEQNMAQLLDEGARKVDSRYIRELLPLIEQDASIELHVSETRVREHFAGLLTAGLFARAYGITAVDLSELTVVEEAFISGADDFYEVQEALQSRLDDLWRERDGEWGFDEDGDHEETGTPFGPDGYNRDGVTARGWRRDGTHAVTGTATSPDGITREYDEVL
jgi:hypothetical protein